MKTVFVAWMLTTAVLLSGPSAIMTASEARERAGQANAAWKEQNVEMINAVRAFIFSWAASWRERDINRYMTHYSRSFHSGGLDYKIWRERKAQLFDRSGKVFLEVSDLSVLIEGNRAGVSFIQQYRDALYADIGEKTMQLIQQNGRWQIVAEEWHPLKK